MTATPKTLAEVLAPVSLDEFRTSYLGRNFFVGKGQPGKFSGLFPWADLNQILRHHRLDVPRLRLVKEGQAISAESFITYQSSRRKPSLKVPRLRAAQLTEHLRNGATLIIDSVDELQEPITELSEDLERELRARIQVNAYSGWRTSRGFDLHWDDHDVIVLQVSGRKEWKVYPMTREYPLAGDPVREATPPATPLWEGMLEDGDFLYIPRGWWHVAVPLDEPTLHLTFGLHQLNGTDLVSWFVERLRESPAVRRDLPRFASREQQDAQLQEIRAAWEQAWNPELMRNYLDEVDGRTRSRPHFDLPWSALPAVLPPGEDWTLKWIVARPVTWAEADEKKSVEFSSNGKTWTFAAEARPLLERLESARVCAASELLNGASGGLSRGTVLAFLRELVTSGLAAVVDDRER